MPTGYQIANQDAAYYLTIQVVYWVDLFSRQQYRDIVIESLRYCQKNKGLEIYAWVIMTNHIHLVVRSSISDLSGTIRDFKKFTSKQIIDQIEQGNESRKKWMLKLFAHAAQRQNKKGQHQVWTHENHAVELISNKFIDQKLDYIHMNPVRAGIVTKPEHYLYSSAASYNDEKGLLDIIKVSMTWKTV
jgi:REP element-mobilizing transposase RayT